MLADLDGLLDDKPAKNEKKRVGIPPANNDDDDLDNLMADLGMGDKPKKDSTRNPRLSGLASASPQHFTQAANKTNEMDEWGLGGFENDDKKASNPNHLNSVNVGSSSNQNNPPLQRAHTFAQPQSLSHTSKKDEDFLDEWGDIDNKGNKL